MHAGAGFAFAQIPLHFFLSQPQGPACSMEGALSAIPIRGNAVPNLKWLDGYSGQTVDQLLSMEDEYRVDSIVAAFEQALDQKAARERVGSLSEEEHIVLAIEALEREVNNGGYQQFFQNESREYAPMIVQALARIGCPRTAAITQQAIDALHLPNLTAGAIESALGEEDSEAGLDDCDDLYYNTGENIAAQLLAFIRMNKDCIKL